MKFLNYCSFVIIISLLVLPGSKLSAQSNHIYISPQIKKLYDKTTRSWDGKPGENYWINSADYKMDIDLDVEMGIISGRETIVYYNNSPDELDQIVLQLFNNFFRKGNQRDYDISEEDLTDGMDIKKLVVGGKEMNLDEEVRLTSTNMIVSNLPGGYVPANDKIELNVEWETALPKNSQVRMGKYAMGQIFAAYFYPKVAVYDDVYGWDENEYTGDQEFYSDFNNYDVNITLPGNYVVWGTGLPLNAEDILSEDVYDRYSEAQSSDEVVNIITIEDIENNNVTNNNDENTWEFKAENVPDFSFGCSADYLWDGVSALVDSSINRKVFVDAVYPDSARYYGEAALFSKRSMEYLSNEMPGFPYPYPKFTSFDNGHPWGGGMETPMMANDGEYKSKSGFITLIIHEMGHSYFPFMMGTNERRYAWMDEGWASFFPTEFAPRYIDGYSHYEWYKNYYKNWQILGTENDIPLMTPSQSLRGAGLTIYSYARPFFAYHSLKDLLGEKAFNKCLHEFMERWEGKHPLPYDFFFTFNEVSGEDLSWFWKPWFYDFANCDLGITASEDGEGKTNLKVVNKGTQPVMVRVKLTYKDGSENIIVKNAEIWKDGKTEIEIHINDDKKLLRAEVLTDQIPDTDSSNDSIEF